MSDSETVDTTQQVTSKTIATKPKNPKRVAAGKATAEKTKQAREAQKKALAEAQGIIANNQLKQAEPPATDETKVESAKNVLTTTQWLSVISIGGYLLQTRRDQKRFHKTATIACFATSAPAS